MAPTNDRDKSHGIRTKSMERVAGMEVRSCIRSSPAMLVHDDGLRMLVLSIYYVDIDVFVMTVRFPQLNDQQY